MEIKFLGTGAFFTTNNFHTNIVIKHNGKNFLIDAGSDLKWAFKEAKMSYRDIDALYISHLHADHVGGVEYLGFGTYFDPACKGEKIQMFGNGELLRKGWNNSWKGGMESYQGKVLTLDDYFDVNMIRPNGKFHWEGLEFAIVQVVHIINCFAIVPAYGLIMTIPELKKKIFFTCDSQHCPSQLTDFYKSSDVVFHDCETLPFKSGVHANYMDLVELPKEVKEKMYLVHYQDNILTQFDPSQVGEGFIVSDDWRNKAKSDGFRGFVENGTTYSAEDLFVGL